MQRDVSNNELFGNTEQPIYPTNVPESELPNAFSNFFKAKVRNIRDGLLPSSSPFSHDVVFNGPSFESFEEVSEAEVKNIILQSPSRSCELDALPTSMLKCVIDDILPYITLFINKSLSTGDVPKSCKEAILRPLIKKPGLDRNDLKNYRPVSNLPFLSKVLEKIVLKQLLAHLDLHGLRELFQSAYRISHSTETALLRVFNDCLNAIDGGNICFLNLLDLSDTIDHEILLTPLKVWGAYSFFLFYK